MAPFLKPALYLLIASILLFLVGGVLGFYLIKMLSVLAFVAGALLVFYAGIRESLEEAKGQEEPPEDHNTAP